MGRGSGARTFGVRRSAAVASPAVTVQTALAAAATVVATAFGLCLLERWLDRRRRHDLAWTISLALFAAASAALWAGAATGWDETTFRLFFLFGAVLNVPFLALGSLYLLAGPRRIDPWAAAVTLLGAFACGMVLFAPLTGFIPPDELPRGSEVFGAAPRVAAAVASAVGALVVFGAAAWSAMAALRGRHPRAAVAGNRRLVAANGLLALGTLVLSLGGVLNSVMDEMDAFAVSLVAGVTLLFAGFLLASAPAVGESAQ
jgi:hypothetical protein